jgi:hypothetical protein
VSASQGDARCLSRRGGPGGLCGVAGTEAARVGGGVQDEVGPLDRPGRRRGPARDRRRCGARARVLSWPRSRSTRTAWAPSVPLPPVTTAMLTRVTTSPCRPSGNLQTARRHGQVQVVPPLPAGKIEGPAPGAYAVDAHTSYSESSPPRQRRGGAERGGTGMAEQGSRGSRVGNPQPQRERREGGGRAGGDQADHPCRIAVEDRAR